MHSLAAMRLDEIIKGMSVDRGEVQGASHGLPNYRSQEEQKAMSKGDGEGQTRVMGGTPIVFLEAQTRKFINESGVINCIVYGYQVS